MLPATFNAKVYANTNISMCFLFNCVRFFFSFAAGIFLWNHHRRNQRQKKKKKTKMKENEIKICTPQLKNIERNHSAIIIFFLLLSTSCSTLYDINQSNLCFLLYILYTNVVESEKCFIKLLILWIFFLNKFVLIFCFCGTGFKFTFRGLLLVSRIFLFHFFFLFYFLDYWWIWVSYDSVVYTRW